MLATTSYTGGTHCAVGPVEHPAGEVGRVTDYSSHILRKIRVEIWSRGPQTEASLATVCPPSVLAVLLLLHRVLDIADPVITGSNQTL